MLTDVDGLYDGDPKAPDTKLIREIDKITPEIRQYAGGAGSSLGSGGMLTKIEAAEMACYAGIDTIITNGSRLSGLYELFDGNAVCTYFKANKA